VAFTRVKPSGWAFGEKLTSVQMNTLDIDHSNSVDLVTLDLGGTVGPISRVCPFLPSTDDSSGPTINWDKQNQNLGYIEAAVVGARCYWPLKLPDGATLTAIATLIHPVGGHGALPAVMPSFKVVSIHGSLGTAADEVSLVTDSSANTTAYQLLHAITSGSLSVVINNAAKRYLVYLETEFSTNSIIGTKVYQPYYTFTMTNLDFE